MSTRDEVCFFAVTGEGCNALYRFRLARSHGLSQPGSTPA